MNTQKSTDAELISRFVASDDQAAYEELVRRHAGMVYRICRRMTGNAHDAEDAVQSVFAVLAQQAHELTKHRSLAGWLYSVGWHIASRQRRALARRRRRELAAASDQERPPTDPAETAEFHHELYRALEMLPPDYRTAIVLHHLEGLRINEIAELTADPVGTVAARLSRGRAMLRERLAERNTLIPALVLIDILNDRAELANASAETTFAPVIPSIADVVQRGSGAASLVSGPAPLAAASISTAGLLGSPLRVVGALLQGWPAKTAVAVVVLSATAVAPGARQFVASARAWVMNETRQPTVVVVKAGATKELPKPPKKSESKPKPQVLLGDGGSWGGRGSSSPEPTASAIFLIGAAGFALRRRRHC